MAEDKPKRRAPTPLEREVRHVGRDVSALKEQMETMAVLLDSLVQRDGALRAIILRFIRRAVVVPAEIEAMLEEQGIMLRDTQTEEGRDARTTTSAPL